MRNLLRAALVVSVFSLLFPQLVGLPFLRQNPMVLQGALTVSRHLFVIELICVVAALGALFAIGSAGLTRGRIAAALAVVACAGLSRVDIYGVIFHHLERPEFTKASEMVLDVREKVLAIAVKGRVRAYPVRSLSYHHIVNDVLEGVAVAATY